MKPKENNSDFLSNIDAFFDKRWKLILGACGFFILIFGLFLFEAKMSVGGDDSAYIKRAMRFLDEGKFPSFQGALYPLMLSIFVGIFGINIMLLKLVSFVFTFAWIFMLYKTFKGRLPASVLGFTLLISSINSFVLYYASQTYNESFFLFLELCFVYYFLKQYDKVGEDLENEKSSYKNWLLAGFWIFIVTITKNIGLAILIGTLLFLLWNKRWFSTAYYIGSFVLFSLVYKAFKALLYLDGVAQIGRQGNVLLYKDPYNKSKGLEDFAGYVNRLFQNAHLYISKHYAKMIGLREFNVIRPAEWLTYLAVVLFILFIVMAIKRRNKILLFLGLYNVTVLGVMFIVLQTRWDQDRLIMLLFPFLTMFIFYGFYEVFRSVKLKKLQPLVLLFMIGIFLSVASTTWGKSKKNITVFKRNLAGDKYYGYSPDWQNYLKMCEWAGQNLPDSNNVKVRKPNMAAIFAGKNIFKGLYRLPLTKEDIPKINADTVVKHMRDKGVTHVIMAHLRKNSNINNGKTINTVQRALTLYASKNQTGLKVIHKIGTSEPAYLFALVDGGNKSSKENIESLKANVIINPKNPYFNFVLGNAQMNTRQFADAANSYTRAMNNTKQNGFEGYYNRGLAYLNSGQDDLAIPDFIKSLEKKPGYGGGFYNLGIAYLNKGDKARAQIALQKAEAAGLAIPAEIRAKLN
ncbi:MAG: glycosyltransferase family 39 protein [Flavobacteriales bacterium]|nr:glycosyltransferase family 39 protein [Flavobacteriales bacterium]